MHPKFVIKLIILNLLLWSFSADCQEEKFIVSEAALYCKCMESLENEVKANQEDSVVSGKYRPGMKLFGGSRIDLDLGTCLNSKRKRKVKRYLESLDDTELLKFRKEVKLVVSNSQEHNY